MKAALLVALALFAAGTCACDTATEPVAGLVLAEGESSQFVRRFTLSRGDEVQLVIAQRLSVTREPAETGEIIGVTCERARVWWGSSEGTPDFDSDVQSVADIMAEPDGDVGVEYAATWAAPAMLGLVAHLDDDGNVTSLSASTGELESGDEEEDAAHAVLAEAISRPESLLISNFDRRERPTRAAAAFGPRVAGELANKGKIATGKTEEVWGWQGDVSVWEPGDALIDNSVTGRLAVQLHVAPPARPHKLTWRLSLAGPNTPVTLVCDVTRSE